MENDTPLPVTPEALGVTAPDAPEIHDYYDASKGKFLVRNESGRYLLHDVGGYRRTLKARNFSATPNPNEPLSEIDMQILEVQNLRDVGYHGRLCGRNAGPYEEFGHRILVTEDMKLLTPAPGDYPTIKDLLRGMIYANEDPKVGHMQLHTLMGWLHSSVRALYQGVRQQQQALVICGPPNCYKSFFQHVILTPLLGGRSAKAARYFTGRTDFNSDLFGAEHLIIEDDYASTRLSDRMHLGARLKEHTVATGSASLHAKGFDAINLRPWWRISITLNDDPEAMLVMPPLDKQIEDKIVLLRASRGNPANSPGSPEAQAAYAATIASELPALVNHLLNVHEIPDALRCPRYNIATFHHPELLSNLRCLSPEADLLDLIDQVFFSGCVKPKIIRSANDIEARLFEVAGRRAEKILSFRNACGTYLGRLAKLPSPRVFYGRTATDRHWTILAPSNSAI